MRTYAKNLQSSSPHSLIERRAIAAERAALLASPTLMRLKMSAFWLGDLGHRGLIDLGHACDSLLLAAITVGIPQDRAHCAIWAAVAAARRNDDRGEGATLR